MAKANKPRKKLQVYYNKTDGRYYTAVAWTDKGKPKRIWLTRDEEQSGRWILTLDGADHGEAKRRITYLRASRSNSEEALRLRELVGSVLVPEKTREEAAEELLSVLEGHVDPDAEFDVEAAIGDWQAASGQAGFEAILIRCGFPEPLLADHPQLSDFATPKRIDMSKKTVKQLREQLDSHNGIVKAAITNDIARREGASQEKLSDCLKEWQAYHADQTQTKPEHLKRLAARFKDFITSIGDKPLSELTRADFKSYEAEIGKQQKQKKRSNKWYKDYLAPLKTILDVAIDRKADAWKFPPGLATWYAYSYRSKPIVPAAKASEPLPVKVYKQLAELIDSRDERFRLQWTAILKLAVQAGYGPRDIETLRLDNLRLDDAIAWIDHARTKSEHQVGKPVLRKTPLLPSTGQALRAWLDFEPSNAGEVFRTQRSLRMPADQITKTIITLRDEAEDGNGWSVKHTRNIGATLNVKAKKNGMPDYRDEFLGHVDRLGSNRFYSSSEAADETLLIPVVNLIGNEYFDGEQV